MNQPKTTPQNIIIGKQVEKFRKKAELTKAQLARLCGYKFLSSITNIEKGTYGIPLEKQNIFAKALNTTTEQLFGPDGPKPEFPQNPNPKSNSIQKDKEKKIIIGKKITYYREKAKMTKKQLMTICGYKSITSISQIERGKASIPLNLRNTFANALNTTTDQIFNTNIPIPSQTKQPVDKDTHISTENIAIGKRIAFYRKKLGMRQKDLAKECNYDSDAAIANIEKGRHSLTLKKLGVFANALHITIDQLYKPEPDQSNQNRTITVTNDEFITYTKISKIDNEIISPLLSAIAKLNHNEQKIALQILNSDSCREKNQSIMLQIQQNLIKLNYKGKEKALEYIIMLLSSSQEYIDYHLINRNKLKNTNTRRLSA